MPEPIFFLSHFRIKEGQLDAVRRIASEGAARLLAEKPRTVLFLAYLDADGGTISFLHAFADPDSMDMHIIGADARSQAAFEYIEPLGWVGLWESSSSVALETLRQAADSAGKPLVRHPEYLAGFLRLELG